eukprot:5823989-Amphidinium_carterae.1
MAAFAACCSCSPQARWLARNSWQSSVASRKASRSAPPNLLSRHKATSQRPCQHFFSYTPSLVRLRMPSPSSAAYP